MSGEQSPYVEKHAYLSDLAHEKELAFRETDGHLRTEFGSESEWRRCIQEEFPKFVPYLERRCGLRFCGRILEIGAGTCWLSAELSKLPLVTEIIATDFSPKLLQELAPQVFALRQAHAGKITRMPGDFHKLDLPDNHFDFVVCSAVVHHAVEPVTMLREVRRVLKANGQFVAIREPTWPLLRKPSRTQAKLAAAGVNEHMYSRQEYRQFFEDAGLQFAAYPVNLATGPKFWFNAVVNGLTHARYAYIGTKPEA